MNRGAAIVTSIEGKAALIDRKGKFLVEPRYDYFIYSEGLFITYDPENKVCVAFDETGKKLFETQSYISEYSEGSPPRLMDLPAVIWTNRGNMPYSGL